jgi:hypothetical protein
LSGRDGVGTLSPSYRACEAGLDDFLEVFFTIFMHQTLALGAPAHLVSSSRSAREGAKRADAGRSTPVRPVHFCGPPDARDQT